MKNIITIVLIAMMCSCTEQESARNYGGKASIELKEGERVQNVTWKGDDLWILTKIDNTKAASTYTLQESSSYGIWNGQVTIIEK